MPRKDKGELIEAIAESLLLQIKHKLPYGKDFVLNNNKYKNLRHGIEGWNKRQIDAAVDLLAERGLIRLESGPYGLTLFAKEED